MSVRSVSAEKQEKRISEAEMNIALTQFAEDRGAAERKLRVLVGGAGLGTIILVTVAGAVFAGLG